MEQTSDNAADVRVNNFLFEVKVQDHTSPPQEEGNDASTSGGVENFLFEKITTVDKAEENPGIKSVGAGTPITEQDCKTDCTASAGPCSTVLSGESSNPNCQSYDGNGIPSASWPALVDPDFEGRAQVKVEPREADGEEDFVGVRLEVRLRENDGNPESTAQSSLDLKEEEGDPDDAVAEYSNPEPGGSGEFEPSLAHELYSSYRSVERRVTALVPDTLDKSQTGGSDVVAPTIVHQRFKTCKTSKTRSAHTEECSSVDESEIRSDIKRSRAPKSTKKRVKASENVQSHCEFDADGDTARSEVSSSSRDDTPNHQRASTSGNGDELEENSAMENSAMENSAFDSHAHLMHEMYYKYLVNNSSTSKKQKSRKPAARKQGQPLKKPGKESASTGTKTKSKEVRPAAEEGVQAVEKKHKCAMCARSFAYMALLRYHMKVHSSERPYVCDQCGKSFVFNCNLTQHKKTHAGEKPYACDVCPARFSKTSHLTEHKRIHSGERPFACDVCGETFVKNHNLVEHRRLHTGEKPYACDVCGKAFARSSVLYTHKKTHLADKPHKCPVCDRGFSRSSALRKHAVTHTGEKPFECDVCHKAFGQSGSLAIHKKTHLEEKQYECPVCGQRFANSAYLYSHKRIHSDERPYICDVCGKTFKRASDLNSHKNTHLAIKQFSCDVCYKRFKTNSNLYRHKMTHEIADCKG